MFVRLWNPSSSLVSAEIEADAVVIGQFSDLFFRNLRERVPLIYLVAIPSYFAKQFDSRALFQQYGFDWYVTGAHIDRLFRKVRCESCSAAV